MKTFKKAFSFMLCAVMLMTSISFEYFCSPLQPVKASAISGHEQNYNDARIELDFNKGWSFAFSEDDASYMKGFDDSDWETVDLPHDFSMSQEFTSSGTEAESGSLPGGTGWYRKWFNLYDYYTGDDVILNFDGAYQHTYVYVNGKYVGENHHGYNSFSFEISDYLICSNTSLNLIAVKVVNEIPSSRWYSGSGINRDVSLTIVSPVHVSLYGPQITTPDILSGDGTAKATIRMHNHASITKKVTVEATVLDSNHNPVSNTVTSSLITIPAETESSVLLEPKVNSPTLWTLDNPVLYKLKTVIKSESGELLDEYHTDFGYRSISWDAEKGFCFNGEYIKLKGVCLHHDQGAIGAVQEYEAIYRQLVILKEMGCNAIRTSHNTTSRVVIDICNQLGLFVVEEFFDGWDASKNYNSHDFSEYFNETIDSSNTAIGANGQKWFEYVVEHAILRDRHDPCVIAWDVGNELCNLTDGESTANYQEIVESIVAIRDRLDPSKVVLQGNNRPADSVTTMVDGYMDVIGGNYSPDAWITVMNNPSDARSSKPFVATEAASAISSRGVYTTMTITDDYQCTSYDTHAVSWGNEAAEAWYAVATNDWFSGEFIWTGFDYIGEPTPWDGMVYQSPGTAPNSSYFGVVDTAGFEKDSYYLYRSLWNEESTTLHLVPGSWNRDSLLLDNGYVNVAVYSNAAKIELLLNGNVIATATSTVNKTAAGYTYRTWSETIVDSSNCSVGSFYTGNGADLYPQFSVKYAEGTLSVKAYDKNNNEITATTGSTKSVTGNATQIAVSTWQNKDTFVADGTDYIYVEFEARDANGNFMNDYNGTLAVKVDDSSARYARIVGVDNGNPATTEKFQQPSVLTSDSEATIKMFNGKALVILKTTEEEGTINVTATASDGSTTISTQGVTVTSVTETGAKLTDELEEVIIQNGNDYEVTLYDEYEMVKFHIEKLEVSGGGSAGSGSAEIFEHYFASSSDTEGCIKDGDYVIGSKNVVMSDKIYDGWAVATDSSVTDAVWASADAGYSYLSFNTSDSNVFTFTYQGENKYYIQNKSTGDYLCRSGWNLMLGDDPYAFNVNVNENGSIVIYADENGSVLYVNRRWDYFEFKDAVDDYSSLWLYSAPDASASTNSGKYEISFVDLSASKGCVEDGEYAINSKDVLMTDQIFDGWAVAVSHSFTNTVAAPQGATYLYESFNTDSSNVFVFTHKGGNRYYIQNQNTGKYLRKDGWNLMLGDEPTAFIVLPNEDGSVLIYPEDNSYMHVYREWSYFEFKGTSDQYYNAEHTMMHLYAKHGNSPEKSSLYSALLEGIEYDYSAYTRVSFEALLAALENGVAVYQDSDATSEQIEAATAGIRAAINGLQLDIKKIKGTLFKYGYDNSTGTADYSNGGILMNSVAVRQMKTAILADENLVRQLKDIIGYDDPVWTENRANEVLEEIAEIYAKVYTLQFTGKAYNGSSASNAASNFPYVDSSTQIPVTLWNMWTKDNTHGANDPILYGDPVHDGASVQGLASSTLENGVVTSHAAYPQSLPYANDGPGTMYDIDYYSYGFDTGTTYRTVNLEYLSGISIYFPDLFTRENLDANGNVTTATTGQFAKYYWDTEIPMFISTDEYGINTYHYDSKDTRYLVQSSFNDAEHTVDMELNEVGSWSSQGPNNGSGFFPFNYQQGTTTYHGENAIYHYGFTFEHNFYIPQGGKHANAEDVIFSFSGDDDVLVYVDGVLVLDNGGLHGARAATINFTNCSINYQYAMDVTDGQLKGDEYEVTYSYNAYIENPDTVGYNADIIAAINKLHEVISDGEAHTLNFFYLERGSSDSNCRISFNLSETSEEVKIIDQNLTLDYGLPVEYNITNNNNISQAAVDNGVTIEYIGLCSVNKEYTPTYTFEKPEIILPFENGVTYTIEGMKYGVCTIDKEGNTTYTPKSMNMTESENYYVCAKITGDPTYAEDVVYYQVEKTTFIPASAIYYEDTFDTITYTNGKVPSSYDNSQNQFGIWQTDGTQSTTLKQTADLTDSEANPYGYETEYSSFAQYSGGSVHYVDVSTKNNPNQKYSGGPGAAWPTVEFTFTGTGFDLISVTDCTSGAFSVTVKDADDKTVKNTVVDTFYGYNYGRIYSNNGQPTLDSSFTPMYRSEDGTCTSDARFYDENGAITDVAHYYDENGDVVETESDSPAYAYAYGWVVAEEGSTETLYQIPVIKITDLAYGNYTVTITPTFTSIFGHSSVADDGSNYYSVYLDAIKIYSPAGTGDEIADSSVKNAYATDDELYPSYLELKDMLIGADSLSETDTQGIIFIDGIAALNNNLETYKNAGPNNELYLAKDQAVAFEIWATSVPTDVQIGAKLACGSPDLTVSYASKTTDIDISTATDLYYSLNTILPNDGKLVWQQVTGSDGNNYYTTGTVVIQNTGDEDSVLSITNLKWTFSHTGGKGYFRIPTPIENEYVSLASTTETPMVAYSLMRMRTASLDLEQTSDPEIVVNEQGNADITFTFRSSADVDSLIVTDANSQSVDCTVSRIDGEGEVEWIVTLTESQNGTYDYIVTGVYQNGYADDSKAITVTATVEILPENDSSDGDDSSSDEDVTDDNGEVDDSEVDDGKIKIIDVVKNAWRILVIFFKAIIKLIGIIF